MQSARLGYANSPIEKVTNGTNGKCSETPKDRFIFSIVVLHRRGSRVENAGWRWRRNSYIINKKRKRKKLCKGPGIEWDRKESACLCDDKCSNKVCLRNAKQTLTREESARSVSRSQRPFCIPSPRLAKDLAGSEKSRGYDLRVETLNGSNSRREETSGTRIDHRAAVYNAWELIRREPVEVTRTRKVAAKHVTRESKQTRERARYLRRYSHVHDSSLGRYIFDIAGNLEYFQYSLNIELTKKRSFLIISIF